MSAGQSEIAQALGCSDKIYYPTMIQDSQERMIKIP